MTFGLESLFVDLFDRLGGSKMTFFHFFCKKIPFMLIFVPCLLGDFCLALSGVFKNPEKSKVTEVNFFQKVMIFDIFCNFFAFSPKWLTFDSC